MRQCAWCHGKDVQDGLQQFLCLSCGRMTNYQGQRDIPDSYALEGVTVKDILETPHVESGLPPTSPEPQGASLAHIAHSLRPGESTEVLEAS